MLFETNTVVWASAGTGKTRKLVDVYLELLERGMDPGRIVAVTFTERAAAEMRDRIRTALADRQGRWTAAISSLAAARFQLFTVFAEFFFANMELYWESIRHLRFRTDNR